MEPLRSLRVFGQCDVQLKHGAAVVLVQLDLHLVIADGHIAPYDFQKLLLQLRKVVWLVSLLAVETTRALSMVLASVPANPIVQGLGI